VDFPVHVEHIKPAEPVATVSFPGHQLPLHGTIVKCKAVLQAKNEVKVLNSLNHPNIVKYYECYQERNMMHIIMEFCQVTPAWAPITPSCACCSSNNLSCPHELQQNASLTKPKSLNNVTSHCLLQGCGLVDA